jgi:hypothetical protein
MPVKQGFLRCLRFPPHPPLRAPRTENVAKAREPLALHAPSCEPKPADPPPPHPRACPCCGGRMRVIEVFRGGAWPAPEPSTAGRASPPTLEPASIPHSVPVGTGPLHHDFVPGRFSDVEEPSAPNHRRRPRNLADVKPATWTAANLPLGVRDDWPATLPVAGLFSPIWRTSQCLNPADTKPVAPL